MNNGLKDKVAIVTGASAGIGYACALELAREGCKLVICSRNEKKISEAAASIEKKTKNKVAWVAADVSSEKEIVNLFKFTLEKFKQVHILVNNTGGPPSGNLDDLSEEQWHGAFENTVMSVVRLTKLVLPVMKKNGYGRIINITSTSVKEPIQRLLLSNSLRPAVIGFSKSVADETAQFGITINNIAPGFIKTERHDERINDLAKSSGKAKDEILKI